MFIILVLYLSFSDMIPRFLLRKISDLLNGFPCVAIIGPMLLPGRQVYFYRTHDGAELDLVITIGSKPAAGIEIKFGSDPRASRGNTEAAQFLGTEQNFVLIKNDEDYRLSNGFRVCGLKIFIDHYLPGI